MATNKKNNDLATQIKRAFKSVTKTATQKSGSQYNRGEARPVVSAPKKGKEDEKKSKSNTKVNDVRFRVKSRNRILTSNVVHNKTMQTEASSVVKRGSGAYLDTLASAVKHSMDVDRRGAEYTRSEGTVAPGQRKVKETDTLKKIENRGSSAAKSMEKTASKLQAQGQKEYQEAKEMAVNPSWEHQNRLKKEGIMGMSVGDLITNKKTKEKAFDVLDQAAQMGMDIAVTGGKGTLAAMGARTFGAEKRDALNSGATESQAEVSAAGNAAVEILTEKIFGANKVLKSVMGKGAADDITDMITRKMVSKLSGKNAKTFTELVLSNGMGAMEEGLEELIAEGLQPRIANIVYANGISEDRIQNANNILDQAVSVGANPNTADRIREKMQNGESVESVMATLDTLVAGGMDPNEAQKLIEAYAESQDVIRKSDYGNAFGMGVALGALGGIAGGVAEYGSARVTEQSVKNMYGENGQREIIERAKKVGDSRAANEAAALSDELDRTGNISSLALDRMAAAVGQQNAIDQQRSDSARNAAMSQVVSNGYSAPFVADPETGEMIATDRVSSARSMAENRTSQVIAESPISMNNSEANAVSKAVGNFAVGMLNTEDANAFTFDNTEARAIFERTTGLELPVVKNKRGVVDVAATNEATKDFLFGHTVENFVNLAKDETAFRASEAKGGAQNYVYRELGAKGQAAYDRAADQIELNDVTKDSLTSFTNQVGAFLDFYNIGRNGNLTYEQAKSMAGVKNIDVAEDILQSAYEAGVEDRNSAQRETKRKSDAISQIAEENASESNLRGERGHLAIEIDSADRNTTLNASQMRMFRLLAESLNINIHIVNGEKIGGANGQYMSNGDLYLNASKMDTDRAIEYITAHELTHHIKVYAPEQYAALENLVREAWMTHDFKGKINDGLNSMTAAVRAKQDQYREAVGQELSYDDALEEIIADSTYEMLNDPEFAKMVAEREPSLGQAMINAIKNMLANIRNVLARGLGFTPKQNEALLSKLDILKEAEMLWLDALEQAKLNSAAVGSVEYGEEGFSLRNANIKQTDRIPYVENNAYISAAKGDNAALNALEDAVKNLPRTTLINTATGYKADITGETIGKIIHPTRRMNKFAPRHIDNLNAAAKLPELFERAVYVDTKGNQKKRGSNEELHHFVAPIRMNGKEYRARIVARDRANSDILYIINVEILPIKKGTPLASNYASQSRSVPSDISIYELVRNVKIYDYYRAENKPYGFSDLKFSLPETDSEGNALSATQREFFKDSAVVDENGQLVPMYHGTAADFTVFDKGHIGGTGRFEGAGFNFTSFEGRAMSYDVSGQGNVFRTYLNITNPISDSKKTLNRTKLTKIVNAIAENEDIDGFDSIVFAIHPPMKRTGRESFPESLRQTVNYLFDSHESDADIYAAISTLGVYDEAVIEAFENEGYDGVIWHDYDGSVKTAIAFEPEQIKNMDNENPTANPDIRFSVRDQEYMDALGVTHTESGSVARYSLASWEDTDVKKLKQMLIKAGYEEKEVNKWVKDVNSVAAKIVQDMTRLNYTADENQKALKDNEEYYYTLDLSTLCAKRRVYQGTYNAVMHRLPNRPMMPEDTIRLRRLMADMGYEVPCGICYEESRKKNEGKFAERWQQKYREENPDAYIPNLDEVTTTDGRERLKMEHPEALESYLKYQRTRGSANPKVSFTHTDYRGDILRMTKGDIAKVKHIGGLRVQSFSDFEIPHVIDMMQAVMDMASMKLTSQAYTKVPAFANIFGGTGIKINLSLIGKVNAKGKLEFDAVEGIDPKEAFKLRKKYSENVGTIIVGADDASILAAWADPRIDMVIPFHRSGWAISEFKALGLGDYQDYQNYQSERYLDGSPDGMALGKAKKAGLIDNDEMFYSIDYWDYSKTGKENAERYLQLCAENNRRPVFYNFLKDNGDGSWSLQPDGSTDGYWKSLVDFKMYNNEGVGAPQQEVKPVFDMRAANKVLAEYEGGADTLPVAQDVVDKFVEEAGAKFSIPESMETEYQEAYENGDTEAAQKLVDELADSMGYNIRAYHGTNNFGFTKFDPKKSADNFTLFFAGDPALSRTYVNYSGVMKRPEVKRIGKKAAPVKRGTKYTESQLEELANKYKTLHAIKMYGEVKVNVEKQTVTIGGDKMSGYSLAKAIESDGKRGIYDTYLKMENPLVIEGNGSNWNQLEVPDSLKNEFDEWAADKTISAENGYTFQYHDGITNTRTFGTFAKAKGYDGVIFNDIHDVGGVSSVKNNSVEESLFDTYVVFGSNQIKSADPFVFDDNGELVLLSKRFDPSNNDIRYSITDKDSEGNQLSGGQREFFKDSKVTDSEGNLLKLYHGTWGGNNFTVFDDTAKVVNGNAYGAGFYFTPDEDVADKWGSKAKGNKSRVIPAYLNLTNPLIVKDDEPVPDGILSYLKNEEGKKYDRFSQVSGWWGLKYSREEWIEEQVDRNYSDASGAVSWLAASYPDDMRRLIEGLGYDGIMHYVDDELLEAIAYSPNQIKLTDNQDPTNNPDIRFSLRINDEYLDLNEDEIEELPPADKRILESLGRREETKREIISRTQNLYKSTRYTKGESIDPKSVERQIRELVMETMANSETKKKYKQKLVKQAVDASKLIYKKAKQDDFEAVADIAYDTAAEIVENLDIVDDTLWNQYRELREYVRKTPIALTEEDKSEIPDYADWRKSNFGRIKVSDKGLPIDMFYQELSDQWPEMFSKEITNPAEQAMRVSEVLDELKPYEIAYSSEEADALTREIAGDLTNITFMGKEWQSYADKARERYNNKTKALKMRHKEAIRDLRTGYEKKMADKDLAERMASGREMAAVKRKGEERISGIKAANKITIDNLRASRDAQIRNLKQNYKRKEEAKKNARERAKSFGRIKANYDWLTTRLLKPTDDKHIPYGFEVALADVLRQLDLQTERSKSLEEKYGVKAKNTLKLEALRVQLEEISKEDGSGIFEYDGYVFDLLKALENRINGKSVDSLTDVELRYIDTLLKSIRHSIANINKAFAEGINENISQLADKTIAEAETRKARTEYGGAKGMIDQLLNESTVTPRDFFELMGGGLNDVYLDGLRVGMDRHIEHIAYLRSVFDEIFSPYNKKNRRGKNNQPGSEIEKWRDSTNLQEFTLESGQVVSMSPAQIMSLYCLMKRQQAVGHIRGNGITLTNISTVDQSGTKFKQLVNAAKSKFGQPLQKNGTAQRVSDADLQNIVSALTPEQMQMADRLQKIVSEDCSEWGNETSLQMYGYEKFTEANYFPIVSSRTYLASDYSKRETVESIKNFGFTKGTIIGANNPIVIDDIFTVVADHCNKMSLYNAFAAPIADFTRVMNYKVQGEDGLTAKALKAVIQDTYGSKAVTYINNFLADIQTQQQTRHDGMLSMLTKSLANYKKATIGANLRVALQQPTAVVRSFLLIDPKYFRPIKIKDEMQDMIKHCPIAAWKSWGHNQVDMARDIDAIMMNQEWTRLDAVTMKLYGALDNVTWAHIWAAVKNEVKAKNPNVSVGSEEFYELCNKRASEVFDKTQVVDSVFHRSQGMRNTDVMSKMMTSFMAEPTRTYNMMRTAFAQARAKAQAGDKQAATQMATKASVVFLTNAMVCGAAAAVADAVRDQFTGDDDDKDYESFFEAWYKSAIENFKDNANPLGMIPFVKDVWQLQDWDSSNMAYEGWESLMHSIKTLEEVMTGKSKSTPEKAIWEFVKSIGLVTGIPIKNSARELEWFANAFGITWRPIAAERNGELVTDYADMPSDNDMRIKNGSWIDNLMNKFGFHLTAEEQRARDIEDAAKAALDKCEGYSGREYDKKLYSTITGSSGAFKGKTYEDGAKVNLTSAIEHGDYDTVRQMRDTLSVAGGDIAYFDEQVLNKTKSAYKKNIGIDDDEAWAQQSAAREYLISKGWSQEQISSQLVAGTNGGSKCQTAKEFQVAFCEGNKEDINNKLVSLCEAGLTYEDYAYLVDNAYRVVKAADYASGSYEWPFEGQAQVTKSYSPHNANVEIAMPVGSKVKAADGGKVTFVGSYGKYGQQVVIDHGNGRKTIYSHLDTFNVRKGQVVSKGDVIALSGNTGVTDGPSLGLKMYEGGSTIDPQQYL